jgi:hypothetical protein
MVCLGRLLSALITTVGPELQENNSSISAGKPLKIFVLILSF